jgi:hypothetical protein
MRDYDQAESPGEEMALALHSTLSFPSEKPPEALSLRAQGFATKLHRRVTQMLQYHRQRCYRTQGRYHAQHHHSERGSHNELGIRRFGML